MKTSLLLLFVLAAPRFCQAQKWEISKQELIFSNAPFPSCHASTITELPGGKLMAAWFGGSGEGGNDVCIWSSINKNGTWSAPLVLATGVVSDNLRYPCWNPVLFRERSGQLVLFYKVGPSPREWWGMVTSSTDDGGSWSSPERLRTGILGPIKNKAYQLADGTILSPSSEETKTKWTAHIERSADQGATWQKIRLDTAGFDVIQPSILDYGGGRLQVLCRSKQGTIVQCWSQDNGRSWGKLSKTSLLNPNSGIDAVTLKNGQQMLVYNPDVPGKEWSKGRSKLNVAVSTDGTTWNDVATLENGTTEEYSYPAVIQASDGTVHITYTYDRKNIKHVVLKLH
jgi:predicted neuraminidase